MKLQQLRYISEVAKNGLNVSQAAQSLYTSQPGISRQIKQLEEELGVEIFSRSGKHLKKITTVGATILETAEEILQRVDNIKAMAEESSSQQSGSLALATTHTQCRYVLPAVIERFIARY
ncbi:MAG: LysR family transcriptional regulator, partial [Pseudomonadales bacterium]|nr:LysR family transcriptional regulator [Pseudomonadales bacterium]